MSIELKQNLAFYEGIKSIPGFNQMHSKGKFLIIQVAVFVMIGQFPNLSENTIRQFWFHQLRARWWARYFAICRA